MVARPGHARAWLEPQNKRVMGRRGAYRVGSVAGARKVDHAVEAGKGCAIALIAMRV